MNKSKPKHRSKLVALAILLLGFVSWSLFLARGASPDNSDGSGLSPQLREKQADIAGLEQRIDALERKVQVNKPSNPFSAGVTADGVISNSRATYKEEGALTPLCSFVGQSVIPKDQGFSVWPGKDDPSPWGGNYGVPALYPLLSGPDPGAGFGVPIGQNCASPVVWMYQWGNRNCFDVRVVDSALQQSLPDAKGKNIANNSHSVWSVMPNGQVKATGPLVETGKSLADLAEAIEVMPSEDRALAAGSVASIDPGGSGKLRISRQPYDRTVAGVISEANGLQPGIVLGGSDPGQSQMPLAISGRVWCRCDTSAGAIAPGDALTTSETPGYAMKAADVSRSAGAVIGKAMTRLDSGRGFVLILVSLK